jgi:hypothetical protein
MARTATECAARSIVTKRPYTLVCNELAELNARMRKTKSRVEATGTKTASHGSHATSKLFKDWRLRGYLDANDVYRIRLQGASAHRRTTHGQVDRCY